MNKKNKHPEWVLQYKIPGTEVKLINGRYYLYGVTSVYDKLIKRTRKVSLGILGNITLHKGFVPSDKQALKAKCARLLPDKKLFSFEYGYSKWLVSTLKDEGVLGELKSHFPKLWQFIVLMVFCRTAHKSALNNICFYWEQSSLSDLLEWNEKMHDQKICDLLFELGSDQNRIHEFMKPKDNSKKTVLMDATYIGLQSNYIGVAQKGCNTEMNFQSQFVLLYLYDANSMKPLYYRLLPGNIREISAMQNTIKISGMEQCVYIADKGFFSEANVTELEKLGMQFIIPLKRDSAHIRYNYLTDIEQTENYFDYTDRFIFYADTVKDNNRSINLFLDGKLREQEKNDYLIGLKSLPENYSKTKFKENVKTMGTLSLMHNTDMTAKEVYSEYKTRGQIKKYFDHLNNTLDASCSLMQREESLNGWMFINHLSMQLIYKLYTDLKTTPLTKKQKLNHKYSLNDTIEHLKSIRKIKLSPTESVITEIDKSTKILLDKMKIDIT